MSSTDPDKKPESSQQRIVENLTEPPVLDDLVEEFPPRGLREAGLTRGGTPVDQQPAPPGEKDAQTPGGQAPPLSSEYDLSIVDEEDGGSQQTRRR